MGSDYPSVTKGEHRAVFDGKSLALFGFWCDDRDGSRN